jgi:MFS family permease
MTAGPYAEATGSTTPTSHPGRSLAVLITGAAMMQAALLVASTASTLLFAAALGDRWAGVPGTAGVLGTAAGSIGLTWLMGRSGRRSGLVAGYAIAVVGGCLCIAGAVAAPLLAVGGLFLIGVGGAGSQLARYAGADLYPEARKGFALGAVMWAGTIGAVGGPVMLAPSSEVAELVALPPLTGAFLLAAVAAVVAGAVSAGLRRPTTRVPGRRAARTSLAHGLLASRVTRVALVAMIVNQIVMVAIMIAAPLQLHHHGDGLATVGIVISAHVLGMYALAPLSGYLADKFGSGSVLVAGLLLAGGSAVALFTVPHLTGAGLLVDLFVLGYGWNLTMVGGSALLVRGAPTGDQLRVQGAVEAAVWGASAFATFTSTQLFAVGGYQVIAVASVALVAVALCYAVRARPTSRTGKEATA